MRLVQCFVLGACVSLCKVWEGQKYSCFGAQWVGGRGFSVGILPRNAQGPSTWPLHSHLTLFLHHPESQLNPPNEMRPP